MKRYDHGGDIYENPGVTLDFSVSTNPLGMPEEIHRALIFHVNEYARYPDPHCRELRVAISLRQEVPESWILCGNGAADLIYRLCYTLKPHRALVCAPTFSEYEKALRQSGCQVIYHTLSHKNDFLLTSDIEKKLTTDIDMMFLCNPNNPTGRLIPQELTERILKKAKINNIKVVIDECFLDFTDAASAKVYLKEMPELLILKAFTKIYSLAGLRLGYLLSSDERLLARVSDKAQCWSVSVPAQVAGKTEFDVEGWKKKTRLLVKEERKFLSESLKEMGIKVFTGEANFILMRSKKPLSEPLLKKGILIRPCDNFEGLDLSYSRIGIKTHEENILLLRAIKEVIYG